MKCDFSDEILSLGIGQCGNNIANEFFKMEYQTFLINSTKDDLSPFEDIPDSQKLQLSGGQGSQKDPTISEKLFFDNFDTILNIFNVTYTRVRYVFVSLSMGGGTGGGSIKLINALSKALPHIKFSVIAVTPNAQEGQRTKYNTLQCFNKLLKLENTAGLYLIDNNSDKSMFKINKRIVERIHSILTLNAYPDQRGNIDVAEIKKLISIKGTVYFTDIDSSATVPLRVDNLMAPFMPNAKFSAVAYSLTKPEDFVHEDVLRTFGYPRDDFYRGYNPIKSFAVMFGCPVCEKLFNKIWDSYTYEKRQLEEVQVTESTGFVMDSFVDPSQSEVKEKISTPTQKKNLFDM